MRKKRNSTISRKTFVAILCVFVMTVSINLGFASYVNANSIEIQGAFNETLSEDKTSSVIDLRIDEPEDKIIEAITLPDQTKIVKENFKRDDNNKVLVEYTTTENKNLEYVVEYTEKLEETDATVENSTPEMAVEAEVKEDTITPEVKKEILSYEVKDIVTAKESTVNNEVALYEENNIAEDATTPIRPVNPKEVVVAYQGSTYVFMGPYPDSLDIQFQQTADPSVATVTTVGNDGYTGSIYGRELGETTATYTYLYEGEVITETYTIKVVPMLDGPSVSCPMYGSVHFKEGRIEIFQGRQDALDRALAFYDWIIYDSYGQEISTHDTSKVTIDLNSVDINTPGKYQITYTVNDGYSATRTFTRDVYVHGTQQIVTPDNLTLKVGETVKVLDYAKGTYIHINDDGTQTVRNTDEIGGSNLDNLNSDKVGIIEAKTVKDVVVGFFSDNWLYDVNGNKVVNDMTLYKYVTFKINEKAVLTTLKDKATFKSGTSLADMKAEIQASASMKTPDGDMNLTDTIDWSILDDFDTSIAGNTIKGNIFVLDPDTGEKIEKEITISIAKDVEIDALKEVNLVVGDSFDPFANVTIKDGDGNDVTVTDDMIVSNNVDTTKRGMYEVEYAYTDKYGKTKHAKTVVKIHGKIQFEGLDRIDLIEKEGTYVVDTAKAFYINNEGKKVYVDGAYDKAILDQRVVGKNELTYRAQHPINHAKETSTKQNVYIHGDIVFHKPADIITGKVNTTLDPKTGVSATFDFVNDDGTITTKNVSVTSKDVTSNKVGYVDGKISAKIEGIAGLSYTKNDTRKVAFNGLPYIDAANTIRYDGVVPSKADIINKMLASAGVKLADGTVIDLTQKIDYSDVNRVIFDKNGNYKIVLTLTDQEGFTTYTTVNVIVEIKQEEPATLIPPMNSSNPIMPETPIEKDTGAAVSRDIPLSEALKNTITNDFIKSYITAFTENKGKIDFEIISQNVQSKVGEYEATIRLEDGSIMSVKLKVVDDGKKDVQQPEYGQDKDCSIHWIILLLFAGYSIYAIATILKSRKDNKNLENALDDMEESKSNAEGDK